MVFLLFFICANYIKVCVVRFATFVANTLLTFLRYHYSMKKYILAFLVFGIVISLGVEAKEVDIDKQIERIRKVKDPKKRVELMNELKQRLAQMNQAQREAAIAKLQGRRSEHVEQMQEYQMHHMEANQKFNQHEAGEEMQQHMSQEQMQQKPQSNQQEWMGH